MPCTCSVPNCRGNYATGPKVHLFGFPKNEELKKKWIRAIRRENFRPTTNSKVCHLHFLPCNIETRVLQCFYLARKPCLENEKSGKWLSYTTKKLRLLPGAVPSQMPHSPSFSSALRACSGPSREKTLLRKNIASFMDFPCIQTNGEAELAKKAKNPEYANSQYEGSDLNEIFPERSVLPTVSPSGSSTNKFQQVICVKEERFKENGFPSYENNHEHFSKLANDIQKSLFALSAKELKLEDNSNLQALHQQRTPQTCSATQHTSSFTKITLKSSSSILHLKDNSTKLGKNVLPVRDSKNNARKKISKKMSLDKQNCKKDAQTPVFTCSKCGKVFKTRQYLSFHETVHEKKPLRCVTCGRCFSRQHDLNKHMMHKHTNKKPYQCSTCDRFFCERRTLINHQRVHTGEKPVVKNVVPVRGSKNHPRKKKVNKMMFSDVQSCKKDAQTSVFQCSKCGKVFKTRQYLSFHEIVHGEKPFRCVTCGRCFSREHSLNNHMRIHTDKKSFQCSTCDKFFHARGTLENHQRVHTGEKPFLCDICGKCFRTHGILKVHIRIHTGEKPHGCSSCDKYFSHRKTLLLHQRIHCGKIPFYNSSSDNDLAKQNTYADDQCVSSGKKLYCCSTCDMCFAEHRYLLHHQRVHVSKKYLCHRCGKFFSKKAYLLVHTRIHTGEKPYHCDSCDMSFIRRDSLIKHHRVHTGEKSYCCSVCDKRFALRASLVQHKNVHTGEKPFQCATCGKRFSRRSSLKPHMRTHTGEKPFHSSTCDKHFPYHRTLTNHQCIHTVDKPFQCGACGKYFSARSHLMTHVRLHTGEKPYMCSYCGRCFSWSSDLYRHERKHPRVKSLC